MMRRNYLMLSLITMVLCCFLVQGVQAGEDAVGSVNWIEGFVSAVGHGTADPSGNKVRDRLKSERAAVVAAQRALLETVKGVRIDSQTRVENMMVAEDVIKSRVEGIVKGAQIVRKHTEWDKDVPLSEVELKICIGNNTGGCNTGKSMISALDIDQRKEPAYAPPQRFLPVEGEGAVKPPEPPPATPAPVVQPPDIPLPLAVAAFLAPAEPPKARKVVYDTSKPVTGVIFDLEGRFFEREFLPVIVTLSEDKKSFTVYSIKNVKPKVVRTYGVVRYADSLDQAKKNPYIGENALMIPVEAVTKENMIIISLEGARILRETMRHGNDFLSEAKVVVSAN